MEDNKKFVESVFKKLRPENAIKMIRKTLWHYQSKQNTLQEVIEYAAKNNISMEEAIHFKLESYSKMADTWQSIRNDAEDKLKEMGVDCPPPVIKTTVWSNGSSETTTTTL